MTAKLSKVKRSVVPSCPGDYLASAAGSMQNSRPQPARLRAYSPAEGAFLGTNATDILWPHRDKRNESGSRTGTGEEDWCLTVKRPKFKAAQKRRQSCGTQD